MTDIIVTVPKDYDFSDKLARRHSYWRLSRWPKETEPGDKIYFVQDGKIRWRATIADYQGGSVNEVDFESLEELGRPRKRMKGFRGYRYYPNNREETRE